MCCYTGKFILVFPNVDTVQHFLRYAFMYTTFPEMMHASALEPNNVLQDLEKTVVLFFYPYISPGSIH